MTISPAIRLRLCPAPPVGHPTELFSGVRFPEKGYKQGNHRLGLLSPACHALPKARNPQVKPGVVQQGLSVAERAETLLGVEDEEDAGLFTKIPERNDIKLRIQFIRDMLHSMGDGEISVSAYDTAWVALVEDVHRGGAPQFPSSLQWIVDNQLADGSWGDSRIFVAHDRIINTLACVAALKSWNVCARGRERGLSFLRENMGKLEDDRAEHMPIGFEVAFPSLIEIARSLNLEIPLDSPFLQEIYAKRKVKLSRIPMEVLHKVPTTLLHSLEGMPGLDWGKLLKLQSQDGSFLFSPSSTAFALMQTKDEKCLAYIQKMVERFHGGVPNVYPVDMFEHIWVVDRLERLGISRYFDKEIRDCLDYTYRYWTDDGICWARNSRVRDVDDTAMGFRLLRLHGYEVSSDAFRNFEKGGEFFCFAGQSNQAVTGLFNLYRASQVSFPGETILDEARTFSYKFLRDKQAAGQLLDKWIIAKDLPGEVGFALDLPWYASLPRIETRFYMEHYGGEDDVWIGKTLYRMPCVNNNQYLELAKLDFNKCQGLHQLEWLEIQNWYDECHLGELGPTKMTALRAYFVAAASIFEPEKATERLAWARTVLLLEAVSSHLRNAGTNAEAFLHDFTEAARSGSKKTGKGPVGALLQTLRHLSWEALLAHGTDVRHHLKQAWGEWLTRWGRKEEDPRAADAEMIVRTINLCAGRSTHLEQVLSHPQYRCLARLTNAVCRNLHRIQRKKVQRFGSGHRATEHQVELQMQEIVEIVLQNCSSMDREIKQTFLTVAKSYYYSAHCCPSTLNLHISKVLFERLA